MPKDNHEPAPTLLPGKTIDEILEELDMTPMEVASRLGLPTSEINGIIDGTIPISADFTARFERMLQVRRGFRETPAGNFMVIGAESSSIDSL